MVIQLPEKVKHIIEELVRNGYEAYAVGGCIRDSILGRKAQDWDITTSASPFDVKRIFKRTIDTGIQHGTVTVMLDKEGFEVTTYRLDGEYEDSRHPKEVIFTKCLEEDLKRRDFTINAMAYNDKDGLVDLFGGIEDIDKKVIRCVGNAHDRFSEDALRILRAVRFSAQLDFDVEKETLAAASELAPNLSKISAERVRTELTKLFMSDYPMRFITAYECGITKVVMPEFDMLMVTEQSRRNHIYTAGMHTIYAVDCIGNSAKELERLEANPEFPEMLKILNKPVTNLRILSDKKTEKKDLQILRWAAFLHDVSKKDGSDGTDNSFPGHAEKSAEMSKQILRRLKFDNDTIGYVSKIIRFHDCRYDGGEAGMRKVMYKVGCDYMPYLFELQLADILSQNPECLAPKFIQLERAKEEYEKVLASGQCTDLKGLALNGKDLIEEGFKQGKEIGNILEQLLMYVLENPELNDRSVLLELAAKIQK